MGLFAAEHETIDGNGRALRRGHALYAAAA